MDKTIFINTSIICHYTNDRPFYSFEKMKVLWKDIVKLHAYCITKWWIVKMKKMKIHECNIIFQLIYIYLLKTLYLKLGFTIPKRRITNIKGYRKIWPNLLKERMNSGYVFECFLRHSCTQKICYTFKANF